VQARPRTPSHLPVDVAKKRSSQTQVLLSWSQCEYWTSLHESDALGSQTSSRAPRTALTKSTNDNTLNNILKVARW